MKRNMQAVLVIVIIAAAAILLTPIALAGNVTVPVAQVTFSETTSGSVKLGGACVVPDVTVQCNSTSTTTAYQYYYLGRPGLVSTTDTKVNSTAGSTNVTLSLWLTTPSSFTSLGNITLSGGVGNRTHTIYLSLSQGVRASGMYKLTVTIDASSLYYGATKAATSANGFETTFKI